jgi:hypothetical protein
MQAHTFYSSSNAPQQQLKNAITNNPITCGNLPVSTVEQPWFVQFMQVIDPKFAMPGRRKVLSAINKVYQAKRELLRQKIAAADSLSLTLDMWSDRRMRSFIGVTVHFMSPIMKLKGYLLGIESVAGRHTSEHIANSCVSLVDEFDIRSKISYIITDGTANMVKAFKSMSTVFQDDEDVGLELESIADNDTLDTDESNDQTSANDNQVQTLTWREADEVDVDVDGQEPLNDETVDIVVSKFSGLKQIRLTCGIHSLQLVVCDGTKVAKFLTTILSKTSRLATLIHTRCTLADRFFAEFKNTVPRINNTRLK